MFGIKQELKMSVSESAMQAFRGKYRKAISPKYNGYYHMAIVFIVAMSVIVFALIQIDKASVSQWLVFPLVIILVNFAEYFAHRWLGHQKTWYAKLFYQRHTVDHHGFFLPEHMEYQSVQDWRVILFPIYLIFAFVLGLILPIGYVLNEHVSLNVAYIYSAAGITGYLFYETMHFSYHLPKNSFVYRLFSSVPGWKLMRTTHILHHRHSNMDKVNFNITLPIFDILLGTFYIEDIAE